MTGRWRLISLIGLGCSSLCALGLPLLVLWLPAMGLGWLLNDWLMRAMLIMFLAMYLGGVWVAFRHHRRFAPAMAGVVGAAMLIGTAWHWLPHRAGWLAMGALLAGWVCDQRLLRMKSR
ncbi:MAG: MerC domain-containing protein [Candidatus Omnitrophica bacterium]|nr:MerC domain-containing protein [Candidatus Omnitrophota bacterium]